MSTTFVTPNNVNRVEAAINRTIMQVQERLKNGLVTKEKIESLHKSLDMPLDEYCKFQEMKSLAFASGKLSIAEANLIYHYLGTLPDHFNSQSVEVKSVLTKIFAELLEQRINSK